MFTCQYTYQAINCHISSRMRKIHLHVYMSNIHVKLSNVKLPSSMKKMLDCQIYMSNHYVNHQRHSLSAHSRCLAQMPHIITHTITRHCTGVWHQCTSLKHTYISLCPRPLLACQTSEGRLLPHH